MSGLFFYYYFLSMGMSWWKMDFYEASLTMVIYYLMLVGLSPSSFWPLHDPLCKVFLKRCFLGKHFGTHRERCAQSSVTVSESLDMYSLHRKGHSLALTRGRAQGLNVNVDSPDAQVTGQVRYSVFWEDFWTTTWTQGFSVQAADRALQRVRQVEIGGFPWS